MNVQVAYYSRTGRTKRLAGAIAKGAGTVAQTLENVKLTHKADILFVGGAIYAGGIDPKLAQFVSGLSAAQVGKVVVFTNSLGAISILPQIKPLLEGKGIELAAEEFCCKGQFLLFNRGLPDAGDLQRAEAFAARMARAAE